MTQKSKSFNLLLRTSFFKNELYSISCDAEKILFKGTEEGNEGFALSLNNIDSVYIYGNPPKEIEIRMKDKVIIGSFKSTKTSSQATSILKKILREKLFQIDH